MKIRRIVSALLVAAQLFVFAGCSKPEEQAIKIAVIGNEADLYPGYRDGTDRAAEDAKQEYAQNGVPIEYQFYSYDGSYEEGSAIVDMLAADPTVTAVVGAVDMDLNKTAAYVFDQARKLFVVPFFLYDSVFDDNNYTMTFSMCNSAQAVGESLRRAAAETTATRWAVCAADSEFQRAELRGFLGSPYGSNLDVVDCVNLSGLSNDQDEVFQRWEALGVEGVILFPQGSEGFDLLKQIKNRWPSMVCAGDTSFDDTDRMDRDTELKTVMNGFMMADEFILDLMTEEDEDTYLALSEDYAERTGKEMDSWYIQGYNAVRMITDTAVRAGTTDPEEIAETLHENGYKGVLQDLQFTANGKLAKVQNTYHVFDAEGYTYGYIFVDEE